MCKILAITNLNNIEVDFKLLSAIKTTVCLANQDGFGYTVQGGSGKWGERYTDPRDFTRQEMLHDSDKLDHDFLYPLVDYDYFGGENYSKIGNESLIAHGRTATSQVYLQACHPFTAYDNSQSFVHNGIIRNDESDFNFDLTTQNDSELLANIFWNNGIDYVGDHVTGYYAFMNINSQGVIEVARDNKATLHMAYIKTIESYIICTKAEMISTMARLMGWEISTICAIADYTYFTVFGTDIIDHKTFEKKQGQFNLTKEESKAFKDYDVSKKEADEEENYIYSGYNQDACAYNNDIWDDDFRISDYYTVKDFGGNQEDFDEFVLDYEQQQKA